MRTDKENYNVVDINSRKKSETKQTTCGETPAAGASDENVEQTAELSEQDIFDLYATDKSVRTSRFSGRRVSVAVTTIAALIIICVIVAPLMGDRSKNKRRISDKAENNIDMVDESAGEAESAGEHEDGAMSDGAQAEEQQAEAQTEGLSPMQISLRTAGE